MTSDSVGAVPRSSTPGPSGPSRYFLRNLPQNCLPNRPSDFTQERHRGPVGPARVSPAGPAGRWPV
jgi:hypothetical protein